MSIGSDRSLSVTEIRKAGNVYTIITEDGSKYRFDPSKLMEIPDYLKRDDKIIKGVKKP